MKREICCPKCAKSWQDTMKWTADRKPGEFPAVNGDGEGMRQVPGKLALNCTCDGCGSDLLSGSDAVAVSLYHYQAPYFAWEDDFLAGTR
jgi:hypothetical protein